MTDARPQTVPEDAVRRMAGGAEGHGRERVRPGLPGRTAGGRQPAGAGGPDAAWTAGQPREQAGW